MKYRVTTIEPGTGTYTAQLGVPEYVRGFGGLRHALRALRRQGYDATRGDYACKVERMATP